jgi:CheY-like chemotaxis protein
MDNAPTLTLHCVRKNGRREQTKLSLQTLPEARQVAQRILRLGSGLYKEVEICNVDGMIETIQNPTPPTNEVLLVEDNAGDALLVGQALAECFKSTRLHIARDGEQALEILGEPDYKPNLIILDLNIPKISGYVVLETCPQKKTPVVVFTASENATDAKRAFSLGAKEFVHKPMDLDEYKTTVCSIVRKWMVPDGAESDHMATQWF